MLTKNRLFSFACSALIALNMGTIPGAHAESNDGWIEEETIAEIKNEPLVAVPQNQGASSPAKAGAPLLKGQVTYCVPSGTPIKLKLASVPTHGMKMLDRDLDGKLHPARENQIITAKTTEDIFVDDNKVIPQGTVFQGRVTKIFAPKRVGRPGSLCLTFESFKTPDGRVFAFKAEANNTRKSTNKSKAKGFGLIMAHAAGGAAVGALIAYQLFGLEQTIAMNGYNIAGAAAAGALVGTAVAIMRKGPEAVLEPGDDLNMEIDTDLLIPAATAPTVKLPTTNLPGLVIENIKTKVKKDGLDGHQLQLECDVHNQSNHRLQSIDLFIEDDNGARHSVTMDIENDASNMMFSVDPYSSERVNCAFIVDYPKLKRKLVWLDHETRQPIFTTRLP